MERLGGTIARIVLRAGRGRGPSGGLVCFTGTCPAAVFFYIGIIAMHGLRVLPRNLIIMDIGLVDLVIDIDAVVAIDVDIDVIVSPVEATP